MQGDSYRLGDFQILRVVGRGYMGKVMVVREKITGAIYAIKSIHKKAVVERRELHHTKSERDILAQLGHSSANKSQQAPCPFLIHVHAAFQDQTNVYFLMDFYGGGDLAGLLGQMIRLPEAWARFYAAEVALALIELHRRSIVYRDLKPENILLTRSGHLVLTDFGLSKILSGRDGGNNIQVASPQDDLQTNKDTLLTTKTFCGTPEYLAPEVLQRKPYSFAVDWWSFGILLYEMLTPFWADSQAQTFALILDETSKVDYPPSLSSEAVDLLRRLLHPQTDQRLQRGEDILRHPFFRCIDMDSLTLLEHSAPFVPSLASQTDVNAFDPLFTALPPIVTPQDFQPPESSAFLGFSFRA